MIIDVYACRPTNRRHRTMCRSMHMQMMNVSPKQRFPYAQPDDNGEDKAYLESPVNSISKYNKTHREHETRT